MVALGEVWGIAPQRVQGLFLSGRWYPSYEALAILGLNPGVDFAQVKKRYRELVSSYHPDTRLHHIQESPDPDAEFVRVQEAYQELERQARLPLDW
ncbi:MAG: J domain-containing protein [Spirochaetales bacterium]|nr:J domain-containing protein [Spirochaetales bacterium]